MTEKTDPHLTITEAVALGPIEELEARLLPHMQLAEREIHFRKAIELPQYLTLVAALSPLWGPISLGAGAFLKAFLTEAGKDAYSALRERLKQNKGTSIEEISSALLQAHTDLNEDVDIMFALRNSQNPDHLVIYQPRSYDSIEFTKDLARFSLISAEADKLLESEQLLGDLNVTFTSDTNATVEWLDNDLKKHSINIHINEATPEP